MRGASDNTVIDRVAAESNVFPVPGGIRASARNMMDRAASHDWQGARHPRSGAPAPSLDVAPMWEVVEGYL